MCCFDRRYLAQDGWLRLVNSTMLTLLLWLARSRNIQKAMGDMTRAGVGTAGERRIGNVVITKMAHILTCEDPDAPEDPRNP